MPRTPLELVALLLLTTIVWGIVAGLWWCARIERRPDDSDKNTDDF